MSARTCRNRMNHRTVASHHKELIIFGNVMNEDIWVGGHNLLLGRKGEILLELEVSDSTRQCKVTYYRRYEMRMV